MLTIRRTRGNRSTSAGVLGPQAFRQRDRAPEPLELFHE